MAKSKPLVSPWYRNRIFRYLIGTVLFLLALYLLYQISFILIPFFNFFASIFAPVAISLLLYYLLRPIVYKLESWKIPRTVSIILIYLTLALLFVLFITYLVPILTEQIKSLANILTNLPKTSTQIHFGYFSFNLEQEIQLRILNFLQEATFQISENLMAWLGSLTRFALMLAAIPFILFYLLKEDEDFSSQFIHSMPEAAAKEVKTLIKNIDDTLSSYINGLVLVAFSIGFLLFIGYLLIGLNSALILAVIALVFTTIPFLGPFLAITPALLVGFSQGLFMAVKVAIVFVIVQQIESNVVSPQIIGQKLHIHPLTIILLLLAAGTLYGLLGLLLATPLYAVAKVLVENLYKIYRIRYGLIKETLKKE